MAIVKVVASVVIRREESVLLVQEKKESSRGKWNLPGGHMEYGEELVECACREVKEETGLIVEPDGLLGVYPRIPNAEVHLIGFVFLAACEEGTVRASEDVLDAKWFDLDEISTMSDDEFLGPVRLRRILADVASGRQYSLDLLVSEVLTKE